MATVGYTGFFPLAPGTAGSVVGVLIYVLLFPFPAFFYLLTTATAFALACWVSERAEIILSRKDSPKIVIDEVVGYLITMAFLPPTLTTLVVGFLFFRFLDIIKPAPAGVINRRMKGGLGVVLDDAVVAVYVNILLRLVGHWHPEVYFFLDRWFSVPG